MSNEEMSLLQELESFDLTSLPDDFDWKYGYFGHTCNERISSGAFVVASRLNGDNIEYGTAFCRPGDTYNKTHGRASSFLDLAKSPKTIPITERKWSSIMSEILADVYNNTSKKWVKEVVDQKLDSIGYKLVDA